MKISVIIPTYNRANEVKETIFSIKKQLKDIEEIIVVDQSKNYETKNLIRNLNNKKIRYIFSEIPSITIARNLGVEKASKKSDLICFLDDDVTLEKNYFKEIIKKFGEDNKIKGVAGFVKTLESSNINYFKNFIKKIFLLSFSEENARVLAPFCNTYPNKLNKDIFAQWFPGVNMCYRKEVFNYQKFDENLLGYTVAEDMDFSYRVYKRSVNSLLITPNAGIIHRASTIERTPTERLSYINQVDHFYFCFKNMNSIEEKLKFIWEIFGITLLRTLSLLSLKKKNFLKWKYYFKSLTYCIINLEKIKKGKVRDWDK